MSSEHTIATSTAPEPLNESHENDGRGDVQQTPGIGHDAGQTDDGGEQEPPLLSLPAELILRIARHLPVTERLNVLPLVCRRFASICRSNRRALMPSVNLGCVCVRRLYVCA